MHSRSRQLMMSAVIGVCLLGGCQAPAPTPAPVPTYRCTPEAGGAEFECTQQQYDEMVAKDKLYAEAEAVYRRFLEEDIRIMRAGGVDEPTEVLLVTTTGAFLDDVMSEYRAMKGIGMRAAGENPQLKQLTRNPGISKGGSTVVMTSCIDSRSTEFEVGGKVQKTGILAKDTIYFGGEEATLRIIGADGGEVDACEG